jgi:signal transduction histidine kinase/ActR/RegA family two-component response regulator
MEPPTNSVSASTASIEDYRSSRANRASSANDERVLVIASLEQDARAVADLLAGNGFQAVICNDPNTVSDELADAGALVVTEEIFTFTYTNNLIEALQRQPPWSELPLIILTSAGVPRMANLLDVAARAAGSITLLERPIRSDTLLRTMNVALRSRRRQYQVRDLLVEQQRIREQLEANEEQLRLLLARERELRQAADEANSLKDEFLATISHELRNPLNVILGYSELLLRMKEINESPKLLMMSQALRRNALAQSNLIRDLLELSRLRSGKLSLSCETVSIRTVIDNAIETVRTDAEAKQLAIEIDAPPEPLFVEGDSLRLEQIIWNLLSNAVKFTPESGKISLRLKKEGGDIVLVVEDTGQGIDATFLPNVFDMFRQGDAGINRQHTGLGIGLALVQQLVRLHKGSVECYSEGIGKGTRFTVVLPAKSGANESPSIKPALDPEQALQRMTVLAVDDDEDNTILLRHLLELNDASVITANSGSEALELAAHTNVDVVLSDISMPGMDGFEFVRKLRLLPGKEKVRVVALTGFGRNEDIEEARKQGFVAHLTKPIDVRALIKILHDLVQTNTAKILAV